MTNEDLHDMIEAFNRKKFPWHAAFRELTDSVVYGLVWRVWPDGNGEMPESDVFYFVRADARCVAIVYEMQPPRHNEEDVHWYVLPAHRKRGYLHRALHDSIIPHIFRDNRKALRVTVNSPENAAYVVRQGFELVEGMRYVLTKDKVDLDRVPIGKNKPLAKEELRVLSERLYHSKHIVQSVEEMLQCHYGHVDLCLPELQMDIERVAEEVADLDNHGYLPRLGD